MPRARPFHPGKGPYITRNFRVQHATNIPSVVTPPAAPLTDIGIALAAADQTILATLKADWDRDGYLNAFSNLRYAASEITIDTSATGDLPLEAGLVEGFASSQLTAILDGTLTDDETQAVDALAPYRTDSALFGKALLTAPVICDMGMNTATGTAFVPQFTGQVRSIRVDSGARSAELIAADPAELLRQPITLPAYGTRRWNLSSLGNLFGVRTQAIIDFVLRKNGIYASSEPHPQAQLSCTGHGWLAAEIGTNLSMPNNISVPFAGDEWWVSGPFGMLAVGAASGSQAYQQFLAREQYSPTAGNGIGMSAWVLTGSDTVLPFTGLNFALQPCVDSSYQMNMQFGSSGGLIGLIQGATSFSFISPATTPTHWQYVGLHFQHNIGGTTTITFRNEGVNSFGSGTTPAMTAAVAPFLTAQAWTNGVPWSNFQVWYDPNPPVGNWPGEVHTSQADLDAGLNLMTHLPDVVNQDSWAVIKDAAAAEYGLVGFSNLGRFFFKSRDHATDPTSIEKTVTADTSLQGLAVTSNIDGVRNIITTETTAKYLAGPTGTLVQGPMIVNSTDAAEFNSPANKVTVWAVPLAYGEIPHDPINTLSRIDSVNWSTDDATIDNGFVVVNALSPTTEITSGVSVLFLAAGDRLGWLVVYNTNSVPVQFSTISSTPAMRVVGYRLTDNPVILNQVTDLSSIGTYGSRTLQIPASDYRQLSTPLEPVASTLLSELSSPIPILDNIVTNGDPELQLADTVRIEDPNTNGTILATVVKIVRKFSGGQLTDTLSVRPVSPP